MDNKLYQEMYWKFKNGLISLEEWQKFCYNTLVEKLEQNKDVFIRLKDR